MRFAELARLSRRVADERGRNAKIAAIAGFLAGLEGEDAAIGVRYCAGELRQGKIGVGHAALRTMRDEAGPAAAEATLSLVEVDRALGELAALAGAGSARARKEGLGALFARCTEEERAFLLALLAGELRQGALASLVLDAVARARSLEPAALRRAAMLAGSEVEAACVALVEGASGLARFALTPLRPVLPMLASPADDAAAAVEEPGEALLEIKLDGARVQAHKDGDEVRVFSRAMNDVTSSVPEVVEAVRALPLRRAILDGEAIVLGEDGRPEPFQTTMRRFGRTRDVEAMRASLPLSAFFFDLLLRDDEVLLDAPLSERRAALAAVLDPASVVASCLARDADEAERFYAEIVAMGHEGVMAKSLVAPYEAGQRGRAWLKIKPAHTLDLVVLAVEKGSGRRRGWLSNLHLGARDPSSPTGFARVGKTFKGMTDAMLAWQTARFRTLAVDPDTPDDPETWVVSVRPEQVVEIALNDVQTSSEYESGVALRFARVVRYREDKRAEDASTIEEVRSLVRRASR
ncbi:MAG: ATP-dependent DNA ligase [Sandaracinaceae bacterium]